MYDGVSAVRAHFPLVRNIAGEDHCAAGRKVACDETKQFLGLYVTCATSLFFFDS